MGDLFMSLIHTCALNDVNPFDYLTELQKHASELSAGRPGTTGIHFQGPTPPEKFRFSSRLPKAHEHPECTIFQLSAKLPPNSFSYFSSSFFAFRRAMICCVTFGGTGS